MAWNPWKSPGKTDPLTELGVGNDGCAVNDAINPTVRLVSKDKALDGKLVVERRHVDWLEHQIRWRWLLDSYEGGDRYRNAVYGPDRKGLPCRNLFRHRREYPDPQQYPNVYQGFGGYMGMVNTQTQDGGYGTYPGMIGTDPAATAQDDDYELRRSRTPVPEFVAESVEIHLGKVYCQEVSRRGPTDLKDWWLDVDGRGTPIDDWMRETVAPLLLVLGNLDICIDHPKADPQDEALTKADEIRLGLDKAVASYILPENMVWWRCDAAGRYTECLVREYQDPSDRVDLDKSGRPVNSEDTGQIGESWRRNYVRYRLWRSNESILYSYDGDKIFERVPHNFGRVPIVRLIDVKKHRTPTVGKSRYEAIAELQREYYNRDSELILSDTLQAHPLLSGAEDFCKADNTLSVGPGYVLPKKKNPENGSYEGWEYVSPPKDPAQSLRQNKQDLVDMKDRRACLTKPAGASSSGGGSSTVSQSGVSKQLDQNTGHKLLGSIAKSLAKAERFVAEYALMVLRGKPIQPAVRETIQVAYPARFELNDADTLILGTTHLQAVMGACGNAPNTERELIQAAIRQLLVGLDDDEYKVLDEEIEVLVETKSQLKEQIHEMSSAAIVNRAAAIQGNGSAEQSGGDDPTGQSGGTMISNMIPSVM